MDSLPVVDGGGCPGREGEIGSPEPGRLADVALRRLDGLAHTGELRRRVATGAG